jgi:hypothetical protein
MLFATVDRIRTRVVVVLHRRQTARQVGGSSQLGVAVAGMMPAFCFV